MPYIQLSAGHDRLWHGGGDWRHQHDCWATITDKTIYVGGQAPGGHPTSPDPPQHEMCPICFPVRTPRGNLCGSMMKIIIFLGFKPVKGDLFKGELWFNEGKHLMAPAHILLDGPTVLGDDIFDARDGFDLRTFHSWWEERTLEKLAKDGYN